MLVLRDEPSLAGPVCGAVNRDARLPEPAAAFFRRTGPLPVEVPCRRAVSRRYLRRPGVIERKGIALGVFTRDVSRTGVGFIAPVQLLPKQQVSLRLVGGPVLRLEIVRCRRLGNECYECGGRFVVGKRSKPRATEER